MGCRPELLASFNYCVYVVLEWLVLVNVEVLTFSLWRKIDLRHLSNVPPCAMFVGIFVRSISAHSECLPWLPPGVARFVTLL